MVSFNTTIEKFNKQGEKTGWTYLMIPSKVANKLNPGVKKSYRVKGKLDEFAISKTALVPMISSCQSMQPLEKLQANGLAQL
jgi:hypothetical protein